MRSEDSNYVAPEIRPGKPLLFVGEAPGSQEYEQGRPFVGPAGKVLMQAIERAGLERNECSFANAYPWFKAGNPDPQPLDLQAAQGLLNTTIAAADPQVVVAVGAIATARLVGLRSISTWRGSLLQPPAEPYLGKQSILDEDNPFKSGPRKGQPRPTKVDVYATNGDWRCPVLVTIHPSYVQYTGYTELPLLVGDIRRAWLTARGEKLIQVGRELHTDASVEQAINYITASGGYKIDGKRVVTLDYETAGRFGDVTALGFSRDTESAVVLRPGEYTKALPKLSKAFDDPSVVWCAHNAAYELMVAEKEGTPIQGKVFDTMHAAHFDRPDLEKGLADVSSRIPEAEYYNWKADFREGRAPDLFTYNARDCAYTHLLLLYYHNRLKKNNQWDHFWNVLMDLVPILADMEMTGVRVDMDVRDNLYQKYHQEAEYWGNKWDELSGGVNPGSPKQLQEFLYSTLGLPKQYSGRGKDKRVTTDKAALKALAEAHPEVEGPDIILKWRAAQKVLSTYLENVTDERIHPPYNISNTLTGRLSGGGEGGINFQNIPPDVRAMFIPDDGDSAICGADWSQIEYRLSALLAGDGGLIQKYRDADAQYLKTRDPDDRFDIHQDVADKLGLPRKKAKRIVHGTNYGMQATTLAGHAGITVKEAKKYLELFKIEYPVLERWRQAVVLRAKKQGYITNPFTRRLVFPVKKGKVDAPKVIAAGPQSTAADMMLVAIIRAYRAGLKVRWTVHDELGISMRGPEDTEILRQAMEEPFDQLHGFWCPVDVGVGANWLEAKGD